MTRLQANRALTALELVHDVDLWLDHEESDGTWSGGSAQVQVWAAWEDDVIELLASGESYREAVDGAILTLAERREPAMARCSVAAPRCEGRVSS